MNVAPALQATQQKLKFNRRVDQLYSQLEHRPVRSELVENNIIKGTNC